MSHEKSLIGDRRFWPVFWTQFWGAFNDNVFKNAMVILITYKSFTLAGLNTEQMVALCGGIFILPFFLFSALAGQVSDKFPKNKLMVIIKFWEIGVMVLGTFGFLLEDVYLLMFSLFLMGLQSTFFGPLKYSVLPELIEDEELTHGNALFGMGTFLSILLGTILGGLLIALEGAAGRFAVSGAVLICAATGTVFSLKIQKLAPSSPGLKIHYGLIRPTWEVIKISREIKSVFLSVLGISWFWFLGAALLSVFPVYGKDVLNGNEHVVTLFLALFSVGVALGAFACQKLSRERLELGLVPFGSIGMSLFILDLYFVGTPSFVGQYHELMGVGAFLSHGEAFRIVFDLLMISIFSGLFIVPLYTFIQQRSRPEARSRVVAGNNVLNALFMVVSSVSLALAYGLGASVIEVFLGLAALNALVAIYIYTVIPEFLLRFLCVILTRLVYRLKVKGHAHIPEKGAAILTCNHASFVDWLIIAAGIKRPIRFVMHYSFMQTPVLNYLFKGAKVVPIAGGKEDPQVLQAAFEAIARELDEGELVCIFPEGKITSNGELGAYRAGVEKALAKNPVPVVPMALKGLWGGFFSRKWNGKALSNPSVIIKTLWSKIELEIGEPLSASQASAPVLEAKTKEMLESGQRTGSPKVNFS